MPHGSITLGTSQNAAKHPIEVRGGSQHASASILPQRFSDLGEKLRIDDRLMLTFMDFVFVGQLADVGHISEHLVDPVLVVRQTAPTRPLLGRPLLRPPTTTVRFSSRFEERMRSTIEIKNLPDAFGFMGNNDQTCVFDGIAEDWHTATPFSLTAGRCDLVSCSFTDHLAFKLRKRQ